jgi:predicted ATPase
LATATIEHGGAIAEQGRNEEGIEQMQEGFLALRATLPRPQYLCLLAKACIEIGRLDDAQNALTEALEAADKDENRFYKAEIHRLKGKVLLRQDDSDTAEAQICFQGAIEIAQKQSAKSWELRATMSLARLLVRQGRRDEGRAMLVDIYNCSPRALTRPTSKTPRPCSTSSVHRNHLFEVRR